MITIEMLSDACHKQKQIWQKEWPNGMAVTVENLCKAQALHLDIDWFTRNKFSAAQLIEYNRICNAARTERDCICTTAWAKSIRTCNDAYIQHNYMYIQHNYICIKCDRIHDIARIKYDDIHSIAYAEYNRACALAFVAAWRDK